MNYAMDAAPGEAADRLCKRASSRWIRQGLLPDDGSGKIDLGLPRQRCSCLHPRCAGDEQCCAGLQWTSITVTPNETLILVTADHETGGLAIGYKTHQLRHTFLQNLTRQKMSHAKFDAEYVSRYVAERPPSRPLWQT